MPRLPVWFAGMKVAAARPAPSGECVPIHRPQEIQPTYRHRCLVPEGVGHAATAGSDGVGLKPGKPGHRPERVVKRQHDSERPLLATPVRERETSR